VRWTGIGELDRAASGRSTPETLVGYVAVEDTDEAVATVSGLGGSTSARPGTVPTARIAVVADDHGAGF